MEYTINEKPGFAVVGRQISVSTVGGNQFQEIPEFWQQVMEDDGFEHAGTPELEIYNIDHSTGEISSFEIWIPVN